MSSFGFGSQPLPNPSPKRGGKYLLALVSLVFFCSYLYLHFGEAIQDVKENSMHSIISNQPDEMAHYFFITELVLHRSFGSVDLLNSAVDNQAHPRSMTVVGQRLEPIGFPFFILLVSIFSFIPTLIFGHGVFNISAMLLVPLLAVASNFLVYGMIRRVWSERVALIGSLLLFLLPPWWYWASHPFQYTIPFVFFLTLSVYGLFRISDADTSRTKFSFALVSALGISLALALRPNELVWVLGLYGYFVYRQRAHITKQMILGWTGSVLGVLLLFFVVQDAFYGSPLASGYVKPLSTGEAGSALGGGQGIPFFRAFLFPFGIHLLTAVKTVYRYFFVLFNSWTLWMFVSSIFIIVRGDKMIRNYFVVWTIVSCYLVLWYGSWNFADNLLGVPSIGSSQIRYFMPIYVGMIPLIAYFADRVLTFFSTKRQIFAALALGLLFLLSSHNAVYFSYPEGLARVKQTLASYVDWQGRIYSRVPENAIVVTRYADKYLFPGRNVVIRTSEESEWIGAVQKLVALKLPVWWHDLKLSTEEQKKVDAELASQGLKLDTVEDSWNNLELRRIVEK